MLQHIILMKYPISQLVETTESHKRIILFYTIFVTCNCRPITSCGFAVNFRFTMICTGKLKAGCQFNLRIRQFCSGCVVQLVAQHVVQSVHNESKWSLDYTVPY